MATTIKSSKKVGHAMAVTALTDATGRSDSPQNAPTRYVRPEDADLIAQDLAADFCHGSTLDGSAPATVEVTLFERRSVVREYVTDGKPWCAAPTEEWEVVRRIPVVNAARR